MKNCEKCGQPIDVSGLGQFASFVKFCDSCSSEVNAKIEEDTKREREAAAKEHRERHQIKEWERVVPALYRKTDTKHPDYPNKLHSTALQWIHNDDSRSWLGIIGISGKCKTRVMSQVVKNRIGNDKKCQWVNATQFQWCAQNQHDQNDGKDAKAHLQSYRSCEFLAFDDLGKQKWTDTVESYFWDLIEHRYAQCLAMIWTSNSSLENLEKMLTDDRAKAVIGRLAETSNILEL